MQAARVAELQELSADDDGVPTEMMGGGETTRIDALALTGLIEKSEGIAVGTPLRGMPQLEEPVIEIILARGSSQALDAEPAPEPELEAAPPVEEIILPPPRTSRLRDVLIGGGFAIAAMVAWYCATQL